MNVNEPRFNVFANGYPNFIENDNNTIEKILKLILIFQEITCRYNNFFNFHNERGNVKLNRFDNDEWSSIFYNIRNGGSFAPRYY